MNKNKQPYSNPLVDIMEGLVEMILELLKEIVLFAIAKYKKDLKVIPRSALKVKKTTTNPNSIGVSLTTKKEILTSSIDFTKHSFIVGASGFGKTNLLSLLQEDAMKAGKSAIFFDPKGDRNSLESFRKLANKHQRTVYVFSEYHPDSISLNPVLLGTVNQVVNRIMCAFDWSEVFYQDLSRRKLYEALSTLKEQEIPWSIPSLTGILSGELYDDQIVGLISKLEAITTSDFGPLLGGVVDLGKEIRTLQQIWDNCDCLYVGLSTQGYGETSLALGRIFLGELLYLSYFALGPGSIEGKKPISIYFDEFGGLVTPNFIELLNKCRGAGMELTMAVQSPSDIDRSNEYLTKQIIENCSNIFIFKQRLDQAAGLFSEAIGTIPGIKKTNATEDGQYEGRGSERAVNELLVHPDIIKGLNIGQCVLLQHNPVRVDVLNLRNANF
jgi:TraM recognition site of TraD and TraG/Helicase HerA, central domain